MIDTLEDNAMNFIDERAVWFVLGLFFGALSTALLLGLQRRQRTGARHAEPPRAAPVLAAAPPIETEALPEQHAPVASSRLIDVGAARAAGFNLKHADDLTILEGIGPKIEELLRANGIDSFVKIACLGVDNLLDILERGGPGFHLANPESWAQQATLAAENRWVELKQLQREMVGRVMPDSDA